MGDTPDGGYEIDRDVTGSSSTLGGPLPPHLIIEAEIGKCVKTVSCMYVDVIYAYRFVWGFPSQHTSADRRWLEVRNYNEF